MAVVKCKECSGQVSTTAKACPHCGAKQPKKVGVLGWLFVLLFVLPFAWTVGKNMGESTSRPASNSTSAPSTVERPAASMPAVKVERNKWEISEFNDAMSGSTTKVVSLRSTNSAKFEFPYAVRGGSFLRLVFRKKSAEIDSYVAIDKGQMLCSYSDCSFQLKVGDGAVQVWTGLNSSTHDSDMMFVRDAKQLENIIKKGGPIKIGIPFYNAGVQVFEFDASGYPGL